jgi:hypothetical protein
MLSAPEDMRSIILLLRMVEAMIKERAFGPDIGAIPDSVSTTQWAQAWTLFEVRVDEKRWHGLKGKETLHEGRNEEHDIGGS